MKLVDSFANARPVSVHEREHLYGAFGATVYLVDAGRKLKKSIYETNEERHLILDGAVPATLVADALSALLPQSCGTPGQEHMFAVAEALSAVPASTREILQEAFEQCPYLLDRRARGLPADTLFPPFEEDLWAARAAKKGAFQQGKHHSADIVAHKGILPRGMPPEEFALCAAPMASPFGDSSCAIADDLDFACRMVAEKGAAIIEWRNAQFLKLRKLGDLLRPLRATFDAERGVASAKVSKHVNLERVLLSSFAAAWPDTGLADMVKRGATIAGKMPHVGIYRPAVVEAAIPADELMASNDEWVTQVCSRPPPLREQIDVVWKKTQEEAEVGLLGPCYTKHELDDKYGIGNWRCLIRFATWQSGAMKWRVIDNGRSAGHNWTLEADERIHTTSVEMGCAIVRRLRHHLGVPMKGGHEPRSSTHDMKRAFRQLPVRDQDRAWHIIAVFHPDKKIWVFYELWGLAFGLGAAVLEFNRVPAQVVALARRWFALPALNFYDDFKVTELACTEGGGDPLFRDLCAWIGWWLDDGKHQGPATTIKFLGTIEDCSHVADEDVVYLAIVEERRQLLLQELQAMKTSGRCTPGNAAHVVGKLIHAGDALPGRVGRGQLAALTAHSQGDRSALSIEALSSVDFHMCLLSMGRHRSIPLSLDAYPTKTVISDASWNDLAHEGLLGRVCFIVFGGDRRERFGGVLDIAPASPLVASLEARRTQIMAAEVLGPMLALTCAGRALARSCTNFFLDNLSGLCSLVKGGASRTDLAAIANGMWIGMCMLDVRGWFDYVESESNVADGGSRVGRADALAQSMGIRLSQIGTFALPASFPRTSPTEWEGWWRSADRTSVARLSAVGK